MNTYSKYCPNVFLAKCEEQHEKGSTIILETKYGQEHECIVFNLIYQKDGFFFYSIVRADGFNVQEWAKRKAERLNNASARANSKSTEYWEASHEGKDFLALAEPIKVGHHSEKRHRALIERNHARMDKSVEFSDKAAEYGARADYWERKASTINLSMPESLEFYEFKLEQAIRNHQGMKDGSIERSHSFSLTYAKKEVKELTQKVELAKRLWD
ncbi:MAG: DUF3560 domain-containing protein [Dyadobacter sp.]|uniref:DUF3560 domain-containing protein n=1 Tax=Dyadobacter sp. TaxID=1914288 RepID=UPI001B1D8A28|nr:DUF3560 domain-containing protein [Dyadobacter sp.]MBO9613396.1 DUF3560 domain-containing protein [Dyadobacter sp.]